MTIEIIPARLRCEYLDNPLGIDCREPHLSWIGLAAHPEQRGARQTAYHILVASDEATLARDQGDLWDSGKVHSRQSQHIPYAGRPLSSGQACWWKVRIWDAQGNVSAFSEAAHWEMGLLEPSDWQGRWIGMANQVAKREAHGLQPSPYLRTTITCEKSVSRARLYITARGLYEAHLNGQRVGDACLAPGWTEYTKRVQYQTYDVTGQVHQGENSLGAILGTGWYCGHVGFGLNGKQNYHHYGTTPRLLLQLVVTYTDGSRQAFVTDETWKGTTGPILYSDFLAGEAYDARLELGHWDQADYNEGGEQAWQPVSAWEQDAIPLVAQPDQPIRATQTLHPQGIEEVSPGVYVYDMGQNMVGWVQLRVRGEAGQRVQLRFAEMRSPDGTIYTENLRSARQTDSYILKGSGDEIFEPRFTFHGFRYVEVTGYPGIPDLSALRGCVVHSDTPLSGTFECSDPMVNQLQKNITWGQRGNFLSIPTDCPQRDERLGWMGDAQIFIRTACYNMDVSAFFSKWMQDVVDAQAENGAFGEVSPRLLVQNDASPAWGNAGIIVPWTLYQMYGDRRVLERHYTAMARWVHYVREANPDLLWVHKTGNNYGDWLSIDAETPKDVLATAYFAYDALLMAQVAEALERHTDADQYRTLYQEISEAFCRAYVTDDGRIKGETQTCYLLALRMGLLPQALHPLAASHLVEDIEKKGWHLSTGFVGVGYLCPVLTEAGYNDVAYRLLLNDTFPSWGYSIKHGATTIWERWDGWTEERGFQDVGMNSFNHYSLGSVGQWLYEYVAGISVDPQEPGFQHILIRPNPNPRLTYAQAEFDSPLGKIVSHWQQHEDAFILQVTIPANSSALVYVPREKGQAIFEGGIAATAAEGVSFVRDEEHSTIFEVVSGSYTFEVKNML